MLEFFSVWFIHPVSQLPFCLFLTAKSKTGNVGNTEENSRKTERNHTNTRRNMRKHNGKLWEIVRKLGKHNMERITIIVTQKTKWTAARKLVTKWLRNPNSSNSQHPFPPTFPHASRIVTLVSLGISHVSPGVPPCFLFQVLHFFNTS